MENSSTFVIVLPSQLAGAKADGCDEGQGYLFAKPMPEREVAEFLAKCERVAAAAEAFRSPARSTTLSAGLDPAIHEAARETNLRLNCEAPTMDWPGQTRQ